MLLLFAGLAPLIRATPIAIRWKWLPIGAKLHVGQAAVGPGPVFISYRIGKGSFVNMAFLVDSRPKFGIFSVAVARHDDGRAAALGRLALFAVALLVFVVVVLVGLVDGGVLLLIVVGFMWEMSWLIGRYR